MNRLKTIFYTITGLKVGLLATAVSVLIYIIQVPFFQEIDLKAFDFHFKSRGRVEPTGEVAIVAIDEKSLDAFGRWPWPRTRMAELVRKLNAMSPAVIAFDVVFSEPDESSGAAVFRKLRRDLSGADPRLASILKKAEADADNDRALASALEGTPAVLGYFFFTGDEVSGPVQKDKAYLIPSRFASIRQIGAEEPRFQVLGASGVTENIPVIAGSAENFGYFNIVPDKDGTVRWANLVIRYGEEFYPHISIEAIRRYADSPPLLLNVAEYGVDSINIGGVIVPTDENGRLLINYRGGPFTFPHYSAADIMTGGVPAEAIEGKIIIIGATATGIYDMRVTPFAGTFPGVEVLANAIDTVISGDFIYRPDWILIFDLLSIIIPGALLATVIPRVSALFTALFAMVMVAAYIFANHYVFTHLKLWLTDIYPVFTIVFVASSTTIFQFVSEERKKKEIREAFSRYVDRSVVNEIIKNPGLLSLGGEEKTLTVLFSDIRGFTNITEKLKPNVLVKLMNDYLIHGGRHNGLLGGASAAGGPRRKGVQDGARDGADPHGDAEDLGQARHTEARLRHRPVHRKGGRRQHGVFHALRLYSHRRRRQPRFAPRRAEQGVWDEHNSPQIHLSCGPGRVCLQGARHRKGQGQGPPDKDLRAHGGQEGRRGA